MARLLLISLFGGAIGSNSRLQNIISAFGKDHEVSIITSDFSHGLKKYKIDKKDDKDICRTKEIWLHVPPYKKNLSFKRIYSHLYFAKELKKYLQNIDGVPDMVYCAMPTSSAAYVAGKWCKKKRIPFVIDVIDIWPDSLIPIMSLKNVAYLLLVPWYRLTHKSYAMADYISAESQHYMKVAKKHNIEAPATYTYLGVDMQAVKTMISTSSLELKKPNDELWICYGGSLGQSYDFETILDSVSYIHKKGVKYRLWFLGDGEKRTYIESEIKKRGLIGSVTGRLNYPDLLKYLSVSDIAFNSFKPETLVVHSYKFNDYIATGCFVMNSLKGETADLIDRFNIGVNFTSDTAPKLLWETCNNWNNIRTTIEFNLSKAINNCLDSKKIYTTLYHDICSKLHYDWPKKSKSMVICE